MSLKIFDPEECGLMRFYKILISAIAPRPIAFVSTLASDGTRNLSPFSYFNFFSANPPVVVFSVSTIANGEKDTLRNITETKECVIHVADMAIVNQLNLTSVPFAPDVDEFEQSGLTPIPADMVQPSRIAEAKIALECKVQQIVPLGKARGAGNLVICEVVRVHVARDILYADEASIDPRKFRSLSRLGGEWYLQTTPDALFELPRPPDVNAIGVAAVSEVAAAPAVNGRLDE